MDIIIAGDFSLQGRMRDCNHEEEIEQAIGSDIQSLLHTANHAIVNYEGASTDISRGILKDGPNLKNAPVAIPALRNVGFDIVSLANNHVGDYGQKGVMDTIRLCDSCGMMHVGAGKNISEASQALFLGESQEVAILNICESEALIATASTPGLAPIDVISITHAIQSYKKNHPYVIIIVHGGCEHYPLPSPLMQKRYRFFIEMGADAVVGHHQHCFCGYELYMGKPIFYGIGNFFFDRNCTNTPWNEGYLVKIKLDKTVDFDIYPYKQCEKEPKIVLLNEDAYSDKIDKLNKIISDEHLLQREFDKLVRSKRPLTEFQPYSNHYVKELYRRGLFPSLLTKRKKAVMISHIKCEIHNEVLQRMFSPDFKQTDSEE